MKLLTVEPRHMSKRSRSVAARKEWGRWPEFLFIHDSPQSEDEEMLRKNE